MQTNEQTNADNGLSTPAQFRSKLGTYLSGVVIGFILLGSIYLMKYFATQSQNTTDPQQAIPAAPQSNTPQTETKP